MPKITNKTRIENTRGLTTRFAYWRANFGEKDVFIKQALQPKMRQKLQAEHLWAEFTQFIQGYESPAHPISGPSIIAQPDEDTLLLEFIDAKHLSEHRDLTAWQENLERYAQMLVLFDRAALDWKPVFTVDAPSRATTTIERAVNWVGQNASRLEGLDQAVKLLESKREDFVFTMQHGDLTPWQIFEQGDEWIVIDGENSGVDCLRFNDVSYAMGRLSTILRSPETAKKLLHLFLSERHLSQAEIDEQLLPALLISSLWMFGDACNDQAEIDYLSEARQYFSRCMAMSLDAF